MEVKDSVILFLACLSILLFGCLSFSVLHNASLVDSLQSRMEEISDKCFQQETPAHSDDSYQEILTIFVERMNKGFKFKTIHLSSYKTQCQQLPGDKHTYFDSTE